MTLEEEKLIFGTVYKKFWGELVLGGGRATYICSYDKVLHVHSGTTCPPPTERKSEESDGKAWSQPLQ